MKFGVQSSISDNYKHIDEFNYLSSLLDLEFGSKLVIIRKSYSNNHISQPADIEAYYTEKSYYLYVSFDSGRVNAVIKNNESELALHRYLLNKKQYQQELFQLDGVLENKVVLKNLVNELKNLVEDESIYFYSWEGDKRYKIQGKVKKRLKAGEF